MQRRSILTAVGCLGATGVTGCLGVLDSESEVGAGEGDETTPTDGGEWRVSYGFEDPELPAWTVEDDRWQRTTALAYEGSASATVDAFSNVSVLATVTPDAMSEGARIGRFSTGWLETSASYGGGVALTNSDGQLELFVGSNNPQWTVLTDTEEPTFTEVEGAQGYDRWVRTEATFDWAAGSVEVTFTDSETGASGTERVELGEGTDVQTIALRGFTSEEVERGNGIQTDSCEMFWDDIVVTG